MRGYFEKIEIEVYEEKILCGISKVDISHIWNIFLQN